MSNIIILDIDLGSRIVTFKLRRDLVKKLDILVKKYGLGTRSRVIRETITKLVELMNYASENNIHNYTLELVLKYENNVVKTELFNVVKKE